MSITCELDKETFVCHICKKEFNHIEGTWLPIGETYPAFGATNEIEVPFPATVIAWDLRPPDVITSNDFTCYNCL